jgi:hypothetical protein
MILLVTVCVRVMSCNGLSLLESVQLVVINFLLCTLLHSCAIGRSIGVKDKSYSMCLCGFFMLFIKLKCMFSTLYWKHQLRIACHTVIKTGFSSNYSHINCLYVNFKIIIPFNYCISDANGYDI